MQNNQVEEITKVLGTNSLGGVQIIENSASGTNYFAKVIRYVTIFPILVINDIESGIISILFLFVSGSSVS